MLPDILHMHPDILLAWARHQQREWRQEAERIRLARRARGPASRGHPRVFWAVGQRWRAWLGGWRAWRRHVPAAASVAASLLLGTPEPSQQSRALRAALAGLCPRRWRHGSQET
jgi:hypothetical protein